MKNISKIVPIALVALALVSGVALLTPRAVHAVVATFVRDVDNAARHPWTGNCGGSSATGFQASCTITVPANVELVIQTINLDAQGDAANKHVLFTLTTTTGGTSSGLVFPLADNGYLAPFNSRFDADFNLTAYADPSSVIQVSVATLNDNPASGLAVLGSLQGYTVSLP
jgi:hypothetical protein